MLLNLHARSPGKKIDAEQVKPSETYLDLYLGDTAQQYLYHSDSVTMVLMLTGVASTFMRPHSTTFLQLPATLSDAFFYYTKVGHDRKALGRSRLDRLMVTLCWNSKGISRMPSSGGRGSTRELL